MADNYTPQEITEILEEFFNVVGCRQYIGARYVPIFGRKGETSVEWDNTAPYEPLTIVLYQGNSFTSRTYVPTGASINDTDYWIETGNYNSQIEAYRQEVLTFDGRITTTESQLAGTANSGLKTSITSNTTAINNLSGIVDEMPDALLTAENKNRQFYGCKSIGFGDSNMVATDAGQGNGTYAKICERLGCTYNMQGHSGDTFDPGYNPTYNIYKKVNDTPSDDEVRLVVLIGGINDYHYPAINWTNFVTNVRNVLGLIRTKFPNACILTMFDQCNQKPNQELLRYNMGMVAAAASYNQTDRRIINVFTADMWTHDNYYANGNHYNADGCAYLADRAIKALNGYSMPNVINYRQSVTPEEGFSGCACICKTLIYPETFTMVDYIDVFFGTNFAYTGGETIPAASRIFMLPTGFDSNTSEGEFNYYLTMNALSSSETNIIPIRLYQAENNNQATWSPAITQFIIPYATRAEKLYGHRAHYLWVNPIIPRSVNHEQVPRT